MKNRSIWKVIGLIILPVMLIVLVGWGSAIWYFHANQVSSDSIKADFRNERIDDIAENYSFGSDLNDNDVYDVYIFPSPLAATYYKNKGEQIKETETVSLITTTEDIKELQNKATGTTGYVSSLSGVKKIVIKTKNGTADMTSGTYTIDGNRVSCYRTTGTASVYGLFNLAYIFYYNGTFYYSWLWNPNSASDTTGNVTIQSVTINENTITAGSTTPSPTPKNEGDISYTITSTGLYTEYKYQYVKTGTKTTYSWSNGLVYKDSDGNAYNGESTGTFQATDSEDIVHYWDVESKEYYTYGTKEGGTFINPKAWYDSVYSENSTYPGDTESTCFWGASYSSDDKTIIGYKSILGVSNHLSARDILSLGDVTSTIKDSGGNTLYFSGYTANKDVAETNWNSLTATPIISSSDLFNCDKPLSEYDINNVVYLYPLYTSSSVYVMDHSGTKTGFVSNDSYYQMTCLVIESGDTTANAIKISKGDTNFDFSTVFSSSLLAGSMYNVYIGGSHANKNIVASASGLNTTIYLERIYDYEILVASNTDTFDYDEGCELATAYQSEIPETGKEILYSGEIRVSSSDTSQFVINFGESFNNISIDTDVTGDNAGYECMGYDASNTHTQYKDSGGNPVYYKSTHLSTDSSGSVSNPQNLPVFKFNGSGVYKIRAEITYSSGIPSSIKLLAARIRGLFVEIHTDNTDNSFDYLEDSKFIDHSQGTIYKAYLDNDNQLNSSTVFVNTKNSTDTKTLATMMNDLTDKQAYYDHVTLSHFKITNQGIYIDDVQTDSYQLTKNYVFYLNETSVS